MDHDMTAALDQLGTDWKRFRDQHAAEQKSLTRRIDELEADRDGVGGRRPGDTSSERKQWEIFQRFLREGGKAHSAPDDWIAASSPEYQASVKAMSIGTASAGGNAVPQVMEAAITRRMAQVNPIRELANVVQITTAPSAYKVPVSLGGTGCGWVGEATSRSETTTPTLGLPSFPDAELMAYPRLSSWAMEDIPNLSAFIEAEVADVFGATEATAFLTGNASSQPKGIFNNAPVATGDEASPQRAAFTLQYVPTDTSSPSIGILAPTLIDLVCTLKSAYWPRATWIMNRSTLAYVRKFRDTTGQFLFQPSLQAGMPATLLGFPVRISDAMGSIATNALPILFADFQRLYTVLERPVRCVIDDNVGQPGQVRLYFFKRLSGHVVDDHAGKVGKVAAA